MLSVSHKKLNIYQSPIHETSSTHVSDLVNSSKQDWRPSLSPNGRYLAFLSNRTGFIEIWIKDLVKKTTLKASEFANEENIFDFNIHLLSWSSDSKKLLFDSKQGQIFTLEVATKVLRQQTPEGFYARNPSWGIDDSSIFMTSNQTGDWQIWQSSLDSLKPKIVTQSGGIVAQQTANSADLYLSKFHKPGIWKLNLETLEESLVVSEVNQSSWYEWYATEHGIYYVKHKETGDTIRYFDFEQKEDKQLWQHEDYKDINFFHLNESTQSLVFSSWQQRQSDIIEVSFH
jgi:Tol biopolymer transport system component